MVAHAKKPYATKLLGNNTHTHTKDARSAPMSPARLVTEYLKTAKTQGCVLTHKLLPKFDPRTDDLERLNLTCNHCMLVLTYGVVVDNAFKCYIALDNKGEHIVVYESKANLQILNSKPWNTRTKFALQWWIPSTSDNAKFMCAIDGKLTTIACSQLTDLDSVDTWSIDFNDAAYDADCAKENDDAKAKQMYEKNCPVMNHGQLIPTASRNANGTYTITGFCVSFLCWNNIRVGKSCTYGWDFWRRYREAERAQNNFFCRNEDIHGASLAWLFETFNQPPTVTQIIETEGVQAERRELRRKNRQKRNVQNDVSVDPEKLLKDKRETIEHRLVVEAREEDQTLVAMLVNKERQRRIAAARLARKDAANDNVCGVHNLSHNPKSVHRTSTRSAVDDAKRQVKTEEHKLALLKQKELLRKKQVEEAALVAAMEKSLNIGQAILFGK